MLYPMRWDSNGERVGKCRRGLSYPRRWSNHFAAPHKDEMVTCRGLSVAGGDIGVGPTYPAWRVASPGHWPGGGQSFSRDTRSGRR
jgi:hypothetical protein